MRFVSCFRVRMWKAREAHTDSSSQTSRGNSRHRLSLALGRRELGTCSMAPRCSCGRRMRRPALVPGESCSCRAPLRAACRKRCGASRRLVCCLALRGVRVLCYRCPFRVSFGRCWLAAASNGETCCRSTPRLCGTCPTCARRWLRPRRRRTRLPTFPSGSRTGSPLSVQTGPRWTLCLAELIERSRSSRRQNTCACWSGRGCGKLGGQLRRFGVACHLLCRCNCLPCTRGES
mmetsp:Transcript_11725/g.37194  ORF Transcript_11725/g.37194 Transcript_11725/m.37194 type:complete len:233 (-) Transcript_11725:507-1205(-)